jgi:CheY-like chemotaxis protein
MEENLMGHVLVVANDAELSRSLQACLTAHGYRVSIAEGAVRALHLLPQEQVDTILLDMRMPEIDGWGFLRMYFESPHAGAPIIAMSEDPLCAPMLEGTGAFLLKPFEPDTLLDVLREIGEL